MKTFIIVFLMLVLVVVLAIVFYEWRIKYYDTKVDEMCAKDGGIKVYETEINETPIQNYGPFNFYLTC